MCVLGATYRYSDVRSNIRATKHDRRYWFCAFLFRPPARQWRTSSTHGGVQGGYRHRECWPQGWTSEPDSSSLGSTVFFLHSVIILNLKINILPSRLSAHTQIQRYSSQQNCYYLYNIVIIFCLLCFPAIGLPDICKQEALFCCISWQNK